MTNTMAWAAVSPSILLAHWKSALRHQIFDGARPLGGKRGAFEDARTPQQERGACRTSNDQLPIDYLDFSGRQVQGCLLVCYRNFVEPQREPRLGDHQRWTVRRRRQGVIIFCPHPPFRLHGMEMGGQ